MDYTAAKCHYFHVCVFAFFVFVFFVFCLFEKVKKKKKLNFGQYFFEVGKSLIPQVSMHPEALEERSSTTSARL